MQNVQVEASKLNSNIVSKRKVRLRRRRAHLGLLPEADRQLPSQSEDEIDDDMRHIILPCETEKLTYQRARGKWNEPLFTPPKSSNYLINGKGTLSSFLQNNCFF